MLSLAPLEDAGVTAEDAKDAEIQGQMRINEVTETVIRAAMTVHTAVGAGLLERAYDACFFYELTKTGMQFDHQLRLPVKYKEIHLECGFRVDYLVEHRVLVEIKAVDRLHPVHTAQLLSYLKLTGLTVGLLINFNVPHLRDGIRRIVNGFRETDDALRPQRPPR